MTDPTVAASRDWDVIIIGTGVGGATVGRSLSLEGLSVLFLEKGGRIGAGTESNDSVVPESRLAQGWWPYPVTRRQPNGDRKRFHAALLPVRRQGVCYPRLRLRREGLSPARGGLPTNPNSIE